MTKTEDKTKIAIMKKECLRIIIFMLAAITMIAIFANSATATIDVIAPENSTITNMPDQTFEYFVNLDNATLCQLFIDGNKANESSEIIIQGFNSIGAALAMTPAEHTWRVECSSENTTESSEERTITLDITPPTIVLFSPQNSTAVNTSTVSFSFVALDNLATSISCQLIIDDQIAISENATNSNPVTLQINNLTDGSHIWNINCTDNANNLAFSEQRTLGVNATLAAPIFEMIIERTKWATGESASASLVAPSNTYIRVEVCPDKPGFVECAVPYNSIKENTSPLQASLPFMNYEGEYIIEAFFNYSGFTETKVEKYNVTSNINIEIEEVERARKNEPVILEAHVSGGAGSINSTWLLSTGTRVNDIEANITYSQPGNYTNTFIAKDEYNNTRNKSILFEVENSFAINIKLRNSESDAVIKQATLKLDQITKQLDANGEANFYVRSGNRELTILAENYSIYSEDLSITKDEIFTIKLDPLNMTTKNISIELVSPKNNSQIAGESGELVFKADHDRELNCSVFINENNDGFFMYLGSVKIAADDNSEQPFGVIGLENKTYWWRVECADDKKKSAVSDIWKFSVGSTFELLSSIPGSDDLMSGLNTKIRELESAQDKISNLPIDAKEAADSLGITKILGDSLDALRNALRDIDSLSFNKDLDESQKAAEVERITSSADKAYMSAPIDVELVKSINYVDYIKKEELEALADEYLALLGNSSAKISKSKYVNYLNELQQEALTSTKVKAIKVTLRDGSVNEMTGIIRDIKTYNLTKGAFIIEVIPKTIASSTDEIKSSTEFDIIKKDPIIKFKLNGDTTLIYYVNKKIDTELFKDIKTAVFIDPSAMSSDKITGFSIKSIKLSGTSRIVSIIIAVMLIGLLTVVSVKYDGPAIAKYAIYKVRKNKHLHYVNVILNEIKDNLDSGNVDKAAELYDEAKDAYAELPQIAQNDAYSMLSETAETIKARQEAMQHNTMVSDLSNKITSIQSLLVSGRITESLEEYKQIEQMYHTLDDDLRESVHPWLVDVGNKIQVMINSNTSNNFNTRR